MSQLLRLVLLGVSLILLTGCAAQPNIQLGDNFWQADHSQKVVVATTKAATPKLYGQGEQGLLDIALMDMESGDLNKYLGSTSLGWYQHLPNVFVQQLKQRHVATILLNRQLKGDEKNYAAVTNGKLLLISLDAFGAKRNYFGFIPTGAPQAFCIITGTLIDTKSNQVLWRHKTTLTQPVVGEWSQAPNYPNLSKAIQQVINSAQQELLDSFFSGH